MNTTKPGSATGRPERAGTRAKPICCRLFDIKQSADFAGVSVQVICHWIRTGRLEAYHLGGGRVRIDEVELTDLISSPDSKPRQPKGRTDGSSPRFASAETSRN